MPSVLQSLLENGKTPLSHSFLCFRMAHEWPKIVGEKIAGVSRPVSIDHGRVIIWVKSSVWAQELKYIEGDLIQKMNDWKGDSWVRGVAFNLERSAAADRGLTE